MVRGFSLFKSSSPGTYCISGWSGYLSPLYQTPTSLSLPTSPRETELLQKFELFPYGVVSMIKSDTATPITRARRSETQGNLSSSSLRMKMWGERGHWARDEAVGPRPEAGNED